MAFLVMFAFGGRTIGVAPGNATSTFFAARWLSSAPLPAFVEECVWVGYQEPQADGAHFMLELKLHVQLNRITAKYGIIW
jgi:hypothetical protein